MFIPDPDFYPSRVSDLGSQIQKQQQKRVVQKLVVEPFFVAINLKNLKFFIFEMPKEKIWPIVIELFTQKIVTKLSKIWV